MESITLFRKNSEKTTLNTISARSVDIANHIDEIFVAYLNGNIFYPMHNIVKDQSVEGSLTCLWRERNLLQSLL